MLDRIWILDEKNFRQSIILPVFLTIGIVTILIFLQYEKISPPFLALICSSLGI
jgi:hypothetical protein